MDSMNTPKGCPYGKSVDKISVNIKRIDFFAVILYNSGWRITRKGERYDEENFCYAFGCCLLY